MTPLVHAFLDALEAADPSGMYAISGDAIGLDVFLALDSLDTVLRKTMEDAQ